MADPKITIPALALVRHEQSSVACSMRDVAREAALQWGREQMSKTPWTDPEGFGKAVATVYLAALRELSAGFAPGAECPGEGA